MFRRLLCFLGFHPLRRIIFQNDNRMYWLTCTCGWRETHLPKVVIERLPSFGQFPEGEEPID